MSQAVSPLTQSRYYSPAFNAAVFDGPIRIYFAQHQESLALKVYFRLQSHLKETYALARQNFKTTGRTIFLMLYPNAESFASSFTEPTTANFLMEKFGDDFVMGVRGPLLDEEYDEIFVLVGTIIKEDHVPLERVAEL